MAKAQWKVQKKVSDPSGKYQLIPPIKASSHRDFRPPPTIQSDFQRLLQHDVPHVNYTFQLIHDWYETKKEGYEPLYIRAQQTPIDWKSKIGNSDMSTNFKTSYKQKIYKGDIVIRQDGVIYMLNWNVTTHPNNQATQNIECNDILTFTRQHHVAVDAYGFQIDDDCGMQLDENGRQVIVDDFPVSHSEYNGRPDYVISQSQPGLTANHLVNMYLQWNQKTKNIRINDQTIIGPYTYAVHNVFDGQVDINGQHGCLYVQLRRIPGGEVDG